MKKIILHIVIFIGALSNAILMTTFNAPKWLIAVTTIIYIVVFELIILKLEPRLAMAERKRNLKTYRFLKDLIDAERVTIELKDGHKIYNAKFLGYIHNNDAKTIELQTTKPKTKKTASKIDKLNVNLSNIANVKRIK